MAQGSTRLKHLEKSIDDYIIEIQNKRRREMCRYSFNFSEKQEQRNAEDIEAKELNEYLCQFTLSVKRRDGKDFATSILRGLLSSFNRDFKECKYPVSIIEDFAFEHTRKCLEA